MNDEVVIKMEGLHLEYMRIVYNISGWMKFFGIRGNMSLVKEGHLKPY